MSDYQDKIAIEEHNNKLKELRLKLIRNKIYGAGSNTYKIINEDCVKVMQTIITSSIPLIVTNLP